jgi:hypothetical protein
MASVIPFGSDRFRLRLTLDNPLPMLGEGRSPRPFDHYLAELVRDADERVCAFIDVYFLRLGAVRGSYMRAAVALGSKHLARVCPTPWTSTVACWSTSRTRSETR